MRARPVARSIRLDTEIGFRNMGAGTPGLPN